MKNYESPLIQIVLFEAIVETASTEGSSGVIEYPWQKDENNGLFE